MSDDVTARQYTADVSAFTLLPGGEKHLTSFSPNLSTQPSVTDEISITPFHCCTGLPETHYSVQSWCNILKLNYLIGSYIYVLSMLKILVSLWWKARKNEFSSGLKVCCTYHPRGFFSSVDSWGVPVTWVTWSRCELTWNWMSGGYYNAEGWEIKGKNTK